jgi:phosphopantothenoylcysteine decarboxylase/phosphopantothenate--cysteine ligase
VTLVSGPVAQPTPAGRRARIDVTSALRDARRGDAARRRSATSSSAWRRWPTTGRPSRRCDKIKKDDKPLQVTFAPNPGHPGRGGGAPRMPPFCVGFAAESRDLEKYAEGKRQKKKLALVVGQPGAGRPRRRQPYAVVLLDDQGQASARARRRRSTLRAPSSPTSGGCSKGTEVTRCIASTCGYSIRA